MGDLRYQGLASHDMANGKPRRLRLPAADGDDGDGHHRSRQCATQQSIFHVDRHRNDRRYRELGRGQEKSIRGVIFTDHPRITATPHPVAELGWFHYTPMRLSDGSRLIAYFTRFANGDVNPEYSFGFFIRPDKSSVWLQQTAFEHVAFDEHGKPAAWQQRWEAESLTLTAHSSIIPVPLSKAWGGAKVPQNLKENVNVPNAFDTEVTVIEHGLTRQLTGGGVYEYINTGKGNDPRQQSG